MVIAAHDGWADIPALLQKSGMNSISYTAK
jgi:hypothetical protein